MKNLNINKISPNFRDATTLGLSDTSDKKRQSQIEDEEAQEKGDSTPKIGKDKKTSAKVKDLS